MTWTSASLIEAASISRPSVSVRTTLSSPRLSERNRPGDDGHTQAERRVRLAPAPPAAGQPLDRGVRILRWPARSTRAMRSISRRRSSASRAKTASRRAPSGWARSISTTPRGCTASSTASRIKVWHVPPSPNVRTSARRGPSARFLSQNCGPPRSRVLLPMARNDLLVEAKRRPDDRGQPGRRPRTANRRPHRAHGPVRGEGRVVRIGRPDRSAGDRFGVADDGIDAVAVAQSVVQAFQNQGGRALARWGRPGHLVRREHGTHVSRQIDGTDDGRIELFLLQPARCDLQCLGSRCLVAGDRKARPADPELAGNPAGHQPAQRAHRPVRGQRRTDRLPQRIDPVRPAPPRKGPGRVAGSRWGPDRRATSEADSCWCSGPAPGRSRRPSWRRDHDPTGHPRGPRPRP